MNIECAELKTRINLLNNILIDILEQKDPNNAYLYYLKQQNMYNTIYKLDKLEKKYYKLCTPTKQSKD